MDVDPLGWLWFATDFLETYFVTSRGERMLKPMPMKTVEPASFLVQSVKSLGLSDAKWRQEMDQLYFV